MNMTWVRTTIKLIYLAIIMQYSKIIKRHSTQRRKFKRKFPSVPKYIQDNSKHLDLDMIYHNNVMTQCCNQSAFGMAYQILKGNTKLISIHSSLTLCLIITMLLSKWTAFGNAFSILKENKIISMHSALFTTIVHPQFRIYGIPLPYIPRITKYDVADAAVNRCFLVQPLLPRSTVADFPACLISLQQAYIATNNVEPFSGHFLLLFGVE